MNEYIKTGICSLVLGLLGAIALQFGYLFQLEFGNPYLWIKTI
jgi:hypothetical protein